MKLIEYGCPNDRIDVVALGVHPEIFNRIGEVERCDIRANFGIGPENHVFLSLGAMTDNKGIDLLLRAFSEVHARHPNAQLVLKDDRGLYGISGVDVIQEVIERHSLNTNGGMLESIKLLSVTFPVNVMRELYCLADTYVSPYRAEGFNLPVLEAIACGTPVIVTEGGATDDFCNGLTSLRIPSKHRANTEVNWPSPGYHLEPDLDALIATMESDLKTPRRQSKSFLEGHARVSREFSWDASIDNLVRLF